MQIHSIFKGHLCHMSYYKINTVSPGQQILLLFMTFKLYKINYHYYIMVETIIFCTIGKVLKSILNWPYTCLIFYIIFYLLN
jgi:hypothetical protein